MCVFCYFGNNLFGMCIASIYSWLVKWLVPVVDLCFSISVIVFLYGLRVDPPSLFRTVNIWFPCSGTCQVHACLQVLYFLNKWTLSTIQSFSHFKYLYLTFFYLPWVYILLLHLLSIFRRHNLLSVHTSSLLPGPRAQLRIKACALGILELVLLELTWRLGRLGLLSPDSNLEYRNIVLIGR